jgi:hypothetical protein
MPGRYALGTRQPRGNVMTDDLIPVTDEQSKAVQRMADFGSVVVHAGEKIAEYVGRILGTAPEDAVGLVIGDPLRFIRTVIAGQYDERLSKLLRERRVEKTQPVSPSLAIPLLTAAYDENRAQLQDVWAKLLANAMDPKRDTVRLSFIEAVKKFDPLDALVLQKLREHGGATWSPNTRDAFASMFKVSSDQIDVSFINLMEVNCVSHTDPHNAQRRDNPFLTSFGRELLRALD